jgi:hypothetical protein
LTAFIIFYSRILPVLLSLFLCSAWAQITPAPIISIEAAQVGSVANQADAARLTKSWADRTKQGVDNMLQQELGVTKEIQVGIERLSKSCEVATALKKSTAVTDQAGITSYERLMDQRLALRQKNRSELLSSIESLSQKIGKESAACGFLGLMAKNPIGCEVEKYKKDMASVLQDGVNRFYDSVFKRYALYKTVAIQAKNSCVQPDFLGKLMQADAEHLVPYEDRAYGVFSRLIDSVGSAFLNQAGN